MSEHDLDLVTVFQATDSFALTLAKSSLEDAGIEYVVSGDEPRYIAGIPGAYGIGEIPLGTKCSCGIQVAREDESEACALLDPLRQPVPAADLESGEIQ
jgi:hypothetical protein